MHAYTCLLCLVELLTTIGASLSEQLTTQSWAGAREEMWQEDGSEKQADPPINVNQKSKRQTIPDEYVDSGSYQQDKYYGDRGEVLVSLMNRNPQKYFNKGLKLTYGVRIQSRLVLTVCSAVTYSPDVKYRVTYNYHYRRAQPVTKVNPADVTINILSSQRFDSIPITEILIHPRCNNQYLFDLAIVATKQPLPGSRNVWIHSAENLLFRRNLDRVVAAHAVLGKCSVSVYKFNQITQAALIGFVSVKFQHWDGCRSSVCAYWSPNNDPIPRPPRRPRPPQRGSDEGRCGNLYNGTRMCLTWDVPQSLCALGMGTPIFCDVGNIHGLMGFIVTETYDCNSFDGHNAIMQGANDGIDWIRKTLSSRLQGDYEDSIPLWMKNARGQVIDGFVPRIKPKLHTVKPPRNPDVPSIGYNNFIGNQLFSVVNVYYKQAFRCLGTLVTSDLIVVPCSCISTSPIGTDVTKSSFIEHQEKVILLEPLKDFEVSLMANGSYPSLVPEAIVVHKQCNSHYLFDSGLIEIPEALPNYKLAWVMTSQAGLFRKLLYLTSVADASMGNDCYWLRREGAPIFTGERAHFRRSKIRFVPWTECTQDVCPSRLWFTYQQDRCFGPAEPLKSSLHCFESVVKKSPACGIAHGTPIFCNVEQTRGFVGFVTIALDLNFNELCTSRPPSRQRSVMVAIDQYLESYGKFLWIQEVELSARAKQGYSSCQSNEPSFRLLFAVLIVVFTQFYIMNK